MTGQSAEYPIPSDPSVTRKGVIPCVPGGISLTGEFQLPTLRQLAVQLRGGLQASSCIPASLYARHCQASVDGEWTKKNIQDRTKTSWRSEIGGRSLKFLFEIPRDTMRHNWSRAFLDATTATDRQSNWANFDMFVFVNLKKWWEKVMRSGDDAGNYQTQWSLSQSLSRRLSIGQLPPSRPAHRRADSDATRHFHPQLV